MQPVLIYLERRLAEAEARGLTERVIELAVLRALALDALGKINAAVEALRRAMTKGYSCVFIREGAPWLICFNK